MDAMYDEDDEGVGCIWQTWAYPYDSSPVALCHNPLKNGFCDYCDVVEDKFDESECPYNIPAERGPTLIEEEVRQYLDYTDKKGGQGFEPPTPQQ